MAEQQDNDETLSETLLPYKDEIQIRGMNGDKKNVQLPPNPESMANIFSKITISWTIGIFKKGFKRELEEHDLYAPLDEHKSCTLGDNLLSVWELEMASAKHKGRNPTLLRAMMRGYGIRMMVFGIILFLGDICLGLTQPLLLSKMLGYFSPNSTVSKAQAWWYAFGVVACTGISVFIINPVWLGLLHLAMKLRVACCSIIYRKALRMSKAALAQTTMGQVVNLMTNDVNRIDMSIIFIHYLWIGPVTAIIVTYFLWLEIGTAAFVGVAALLASIPLQMWLGKQKSIYRLRTAQRTDERLNLMNEIINGMLIIKMYTWEKPFEKLVSEARRLEIKEIRGSSYITGVMLSFLLFNNRLAIFCSIVTYVLMGNAINASTVYVVTAYFTLLRQMMSDFFPLAIGLTAELLVSIQRIETFMNYDEIYNQISSKNDDKGYYNETSTDEEFQTKPMEVIEYGLEDKAHGGIALINASARWNKDAAEDTLTNMTIHFPPQKLSIIIGPVGSGKSSLLHAVLEELPLSSGWLKLNGKVSYASQEPWLFEGTVRQNILFGRAYSENRYNQVLHVCALRTDLQQLAYGDMTRVGDRGVVLSGGQRARINLARAIYREADIYLLDDPLSAVDSRVSKHLFDECISGFLNGKTVILVTHQLQYLKAAEHIVLLQDGTVNAQGTFQELKSSGADMSSMMLDNHHSEHRMVEPDSTVHDPDQSCSSEKDEQEAIDEMRTKGSVSGQVFKAYLTAGGHWLSMVFLIFMFSLTQFLGSAGDYWLTYWVNLEEYVYHQDANNSTNTHPDYPFYLSQAWCIIIFTIIIAATIVVSLGRSYLFFYMCMRSSMWLHNTMFSSITRAVMKFFHTNQSGRILNRFSKDMGSVDELLPSTLLDVLQIGLTVVGVVGVLLLVNAWLMLPTLLIWVIFYFLRNIYLMTSRGVKRLEGITRSPVFSHLNASLQGLSTIRAFEAESILQKEFDNHQDLNSSAFFIFTAISRSFGFWLDIVCFLYIAIVTFSFLFVDGSWLGGSVGLAVTQTITLVGMFQWGVKQSADLENYMTSVERILEYTKVDKEPPLESAPDKKPPPEWPTKGKIEFNNVSMAYDSTLPPALKELSFTVQSCEKIGIVGRTGAGKSSLTAALFRLAPIQGRILIDDIDINSIGLHDLRSKISIIPQEPVLFSGTIRKNLDPFDEYPDQIIWNALEEVELKEFVRDTMTEGLNSKITESGSNLSVGQRQLMCLARAIVRNNRVLVMDEATANVDPQTDALIQSTIKHKFSTCTVLTIAHRLNTVMDSDKILVIDNGCLVEFDHPYILLSTKQGYLYKMVEQLGQSVAESLYNTATLNYQAHIQTDALT